MDNATRKLMGFPHTGEREQERRKRQHERNMVHRIVRELCSDEQNALDALPTQGKMLPLQQG